MGTVQFEDSNNKEQPHLKVYKKRKMNRHFILFIVFVNAFFITEATISCPAACHSCQTSSGLCKQWCSTYNWCGNTTQHMNGGTDCRGCAGPDCDCKEASGGCIISLAPPYGYRCECMYKVLLGFRYCAGVPKKCDDSDVGKSYGEKDMGCKSCFEKECCLGNCEGY